jgi:radical SAM superfamily enzyme YgiQ (UPF0313 family)
LKGRAWLEQIPGLHFREASGDIHIGSHALPIVDLDALAPPHTAQHLFDGQWYETSDRNVIPGGILASRGCPAECSFCANYVTGRSLRWRSLQGIIDELNAYHALSGATFFAFWDDALTANRRRLMDLCSALRSDLSFDLRWSAITQANAVSRGVLTAMRRAGCCAINFGVESGDDKILRTIGKKITTDKVRAALEWSKNEGLRTICNFMLGFPQETPQSLERTLRFMEQIAPLVDSFSTLGVVVPFPGTPLYVENHQKYGFTQWWLREACDCYSELTSPSKAGRFSDQYADDPNLRLDFFHYSREMREMIRTCLRFKATHNMRNMGITPQADATNS